jgi:hypothetical protein
MCVCMYVCMYVCIICVCMYVCKYVRVPACTLCSTYTCMKYVHSILRTSVSVLTLQHVNTLCRQYVEM